MRGDGSYDLDGNKLVERKADRHRWAENYEELLNVQDVLQASVAAVGSDRMMPVFGRLNDKGVEERKINMKGGEVPGLDLCSVNFLRK